MARSHFTYKVFASLTALIAGGIFSGSAQAQHTVRADFGAVRVAGPDSLFSMVLTVDPADVNLSGFSFLVAYDNTQVSLLSATANTGQEATAAPQYELGSEMPLSGVPNVNTFRPITMDTAMDLYTPTNLVQLNFQATSAYGDPYNRVWLHLDSWGVDGGLIDGMDDDNEPEPIPTAYLDSESQEVPVSLSGFTLE